MIDISEYKYFMGISSFPQFEVEYYRYSDAQDFVYASCAEYDPRTKNHKLLLPANLKPPTFIVFHELTHILDIEMLSNGDRTHDFCLTGYMEYHASQVELMALMGATTIREKLSFSMEESINYFDYTVCQYLDSKLENAKTLIVDSNHKKRCDGLGVFFNFLGLKSICSMFATDFKDNYSYQRFVDHMPSLLFMETRKHFTGWIDDIDKAVGLYAQMLNAIDS